jgi:hypothetical protein
MKPFYKLLGLNKPTPGIFGIEIEAEGHGLREVKNKWWRTEDDGSLRGNYPEEKAEFVLKEPITLIDVKPALQSLVKALEGAEFNFSYRTSVHVHVNVQELTHVQILNLIYTYLLLEEPLMTYCGKSRKGNRFCLRLADAEGVLEVLQGMFRDGEGSHHAAGDNVRYSAINLAALNKYGSLEFRAMRGNLDVEVLTTWVEALNKLRVFALQVENPKEILKLVEKFGAEGFMRNIMGGLYDVLAYPRMLRDIARSFSISLDLPYSYKAPVEIPEGVVGKRIKVGNGVPIPNNPPAGTMIEYAGNWYIYQNNDWKKQEKPKPIKRVVGNNAVAAAFEAVAGNWQAVPVQEDD